jgi:hypothetical protein
MEFSDVSLQKFVLTLNFDQSYETVQVMYATLNGLVVQRSQGRFFCAQKYNKKGQRLVVICMGKPKNGRGKEKWTVESVWPMIAAAEFSCGLASNILSPQPICVIVQKAIGFPISISGFQLKEAKMN